MSNKVEYNVKKKTTAFVQCSDCSGTGKKSRTFQGAKFVDNCFRCKGTGREAITHETDVTLLQALKELNLIK